MFPIRIRYVTRPSHAQAKEEILVREIRQLVAGNDVGRKLIGLLAAAEGGLTHGDIAELAEVTEGDIERCLKTVVGRSFRTRTSSWQGQEVYVLAHQELQVVANGELGKSRLTAYREDLHKWATKYRNRKWPQSTPEYLLQGYFLMLLRCDDIPRIIEYATDPHRYDRIRMVSGGDTAGLDQLLRAHDHIARHRPIDLAAIARIAVHREYIEARNALIPPGLPALWITLGCPARAEAQAGSVRSVAWEREALPLMAAARARTGDMSGALKYVDVLADNSSHHTALLWIAQASAKAGSLMAACDLARAITDPYVRAQALIRVAQAAADGQEVERARNLISEVAPFVRE
jgi:hypothetical protein